ncbi:MAG: aldehyde dehydrogenase family protein [Anaerolineales bacterium]|nr:aldehyde dehydrogenase family protein [Anaerolineales bacterium]
MTPAPPPAPTLHTSTQAFLAGGPKRLLIGGEWQSAAGGETFATPNPATGQTLVEAALARAADVDRAVAAARQALERGPWPALSEADRGNLLWKTADLIERHADELAELETLDNGKPLRASRRGDLPMAMRHFRYYAGWAGKLEGATIPVSQPNQFAYTLREPMGMVGLIIPCNLPLLMAARKLAPALACGNTTLLKPAEETPLTALRLGPWAAISRAASSARWGLRRSAYTRRPRPFGLGCSRRGRLAWNPPKLTA